MSPTIKAHLDAIRTGAITKSNVIGIRKAINHVERITAGWSGNRSSATVDDVAEIESALETCRPVVTGELHASGLKLLNSPRYRKRLADFAGSIEAIDHFRLLRFDRIGRNEDHAIPVYSVWSKIPLKGDAMDGGTYAAFAFRNIPWQTALSFGEESGPVIVPEKI